MCYILSMCSTTSSHDLLVILSIHLGLCLLVLVSCMLHASSNAIRRGHSSMDVDVVHASSVVVCMLCLYAVHSYCWSSGYSSSSCYSESSLLVLVLVVLLLKHTRGQCYT